MAKACGEVADGLLGHPLASPRYLTEVIRPAIAAGAERAGRKPSEVNLTAAPMISISDDVDLARREVKLQIAFYATTRTYTRILEMHGRAHLVPDLRAAFDRKDKQRMIALIDDELCDEIAVAGTADEVRDRIKRWDGIADRMMLTPPWYGPKMERLFELGTAILETFGNER
jgi:alkanesulfonate monooxygenase SsuD/methylene tetrahydromethanopterin reductase-like flavin-dependent oxidoreductase (luciferase family)